MEHVLNGGGVEIGCSCDAALIDELEITREGLNRPFHTITARASQLDEIVRGGEGNQESSIVAENAPKFTRIHSRCDGEDDGEGPVGVRHEAIGIGHDPLAARITARRGIHGWNRDVDAVRGEASLLGEGTEMEAVATAGVENDVARGWSDDIGDAME